MYDVFELHVFFLMQLGRFSRPVVVFKFSALSLQLKLSYGLTEPVCCVASWVFPTPLHRLGYNKYTLVLPSIN